MHIQSEILKHRAEFLRDFRNHKYEVTEAGILFPRSKTLISGVYSHDVNGQDERHDSNLVVTEGMNHILDVALHDGVKNSTWYLALFSGNVTPLSTWTAANFAANATEITSQTEGYSEAARQLFNEAAPAGGSCTNSANKAAFTIATATSVTIWGAAMLSSSTRGGTAGALLSAAKFAAYRTLYNADILNIGYTLTLTSA